MMTNTPLELVSKPTASPPKKIILVDSDATAREKLKNLFDRQPEYDLCATLSDGMEALEYFRAGNTPDLMILDMLLSTVDGETLLNLLRYEKLAPDMHIVVTTAFAREDLVVAALRSGVSHFVVRPCPPESILRRVQACFNHLVLPEPVAAASETPPLDEKITTLFLTIGIPAHIKGYHFLREAVRLAVLQPDVMEHVTKRLYPSIAARFRTEPGKVERAIRHAIDVVWTRGRVENINKAFGIPIYTGKVRPTNSEFIALIADRLFARRIA